MKKGKAIYEFIEKFAYFACSAIIVVENYTMADAEDGYKQLIRAFDMYIQYFDRMEEGIHRGECSQEAADVCLGTYLNWLKNSCIKNFTYTMINCLSERSENDPDIRHIENMVKEKFRKIDFSGFNNADLQKILEDIRVIEEGAMIE